MKEKINKFRYVTTLDKEENSTSQILHICRLNINDIETLTANFQVPEIYTEVISRNKGFAITIKMEKGKGDALLASQHYKPNNSRQLIPNERDETLNDTELIKINQRRMMCFKQKVVITINYRNSKFPFPSF